MPLTITAATTEWLTLAEVKAHADVLLSKDNDELDLFRGAAQEAVEGIIGPVLWRNVVETVQAPTGVAVLRHMPVVSVTSLTSSGAAVTYTLDATAGLLRDVHAYGDLTVVYVAGRTVVPDSVRVAGLIIAADLWASQKGNAPSALPDDADAGAAFPGSFYELPRKAKRLLQPYALPPAVA